MSAVVNQQTDSIIMSMMRQVYDLEPLTFTDPVLQAQFVGRVQCAMHKVARDMSVIFDCEYIKVASRCFAVKPAVLESLKQYKQAAYVNLALALDATRFEDIEKHALNLIRCATQHDQTVNNLCSTNSLLVWSVGNRLLGQLVTRIANPPSRKTVVLLCNVVGAYLQKTVQEHGDAASIYLSGAEFVISAAHKIPLLMNAGQAFGWKGDYESAYSCFTRAVDLSRGTDSLAKTSRLCCMHILQPLAFGPFCATVGADEGAFAEAMKNTCTCMSVPSCSTLPMWFVRWMKTKEENNNGAQKCNANHHQPPPMAVEKP